MIAPSTPSTPSSQETTTQFEHAPLSTDARIYPFWFALHPIARSRTLLQSLLVLNWINHFVSLHDSFPASVTCFAAQMIQLFLGRIWTWWTKSQAHEASATDFISRALWWVQTHRADSSIFNTLQETKMKSRSDQRIFLKEGTLRVGEKPPVARN